MRLPIRTLVRPSVLNGQSNGKLPASILTTVPGQAGGVDIRLVDPAARAFRAMAATAAKAGIVLKIGTLNNAYRPYADQERIFLQRYYPSILGTKRWNGQRWRKRSGVAAAAVPGTSNHGWGLAVDLGEELDGDPGTESISDAAVAWLVSNAHWFGFSAELQSEPWHWRYFAGDMIPSLVITYERSLAAPPTAPPPVSLEDDDMPKYLADAGHIYLVGNGWHRKVSSAPSAEPAPGFHEFILPDMVAAGVSVDITDARKR